MKGPSSIDIVAALPPPGRLRKMAPKEGEEGSDEEESKEDPEEEYSEKEDSMKSFAEALKGDDVKAMLDAYENVKANC